MSLLFNMLSRLVITFLPRSKHLLISWHIPEYIIGRRQENNKERWEGWGSWRKAAHSRGRVQFGAKHPELKFWPFFCMILSNLCHLSPNRHPPGWNTVSDALHQDHYVYKMSTEGNTHLLSALHHPWLEPWKGLSDLTEGLSYLSAGRNRG